MSFEKFCDKAHHNASLRFQAILLLTQFCWERYRIVLISGSLFCAPQFLDLFWNRQLDFSRTRVNATPLRTTFWNGPKWNGYRTLVNRALPFYAVAEGGQLTYFSGGYVCRMTQNCDP